MKPTTKHEQSKIYGFMALDERVKHDAAGQISALYIKKESVKCCRSAMGLSSSPGDN